MIDLLTPESIQKAVEYLKPFGWERDHRFNHGAYLVHANDSDNPQSLVYALGMQTLAQITAAPTLPDFATPREAGPLCHKLKAWPCFYQQVAMGHKPFELRQADRDYRLGDYIQLQEYMNEAKVFTGNEVFLEIINALPGPWGGLAAGWVILAVQLVDDPLPQTLKGE